MKPAKNTQQERQQAKALAVAHDGQHAESELLRGTLACCTRWPQPTGHPRSFQCLQIGNCIARHPDGLHHHDHDRFRSVVIHPPCYVRARLQLIGHFKSRTADIYLRVRLQIIRHARIEHVFKIWVMHGL